MKLQSSTRQLLRQWMDLKATQQDQIGTTYCTLEFHPSSPGIRHCIVIEDGFGHTHLAIKVGMSARI